MSINLPPSKDPPPDHMNYDPSCFVGREEILEEIASKAREVRQGLPITEPVMHLWGVPGIGKSWLLRHVSYKYSSNHSRHHGHTKEKKVLPLLIDFTGFQSSGVQELVEYLICEIASCLDLEEPSRSEQHLEEFLVRLKELSTRFVMLLLLDAYLLNFSG